MHDKWQRGAWVMHDQWQRGAGSCNTSGWVTHDKCQRGAGSCISGMSEICSVHVMAILLLGSWGPSTPIVCAQIVLQ